MMAAAGNAERDAQAADTTAAAAAAAEVDRALTGTTADAALDQSETDANEAPEEEPVEDDAVLDPESTSG